MNVFSARRSYVASYDEQIKKWRVYYLLVYSCCEKSQLSNASYSSTYFSHISYFNRHLRSSHNIYYRFLILYSIYVSMCKRMKEKYKKLQIMKTETFIMNEKLDKLRNHHTFKKTIVFLN